MKMMKWAALAMMAVGLFAVFAIFPDSGVPAFTSAAAVPHAYAAIVLAFGLDPLRAQLAEVQAAAAAKVTEMKDGLAADAIARIETEHAALLADVATVREAIAAEEKRSPAPVPPVPAKPWAAGFYAGASETGVALRELNEIVLASASHDQAKDALITLMGKRNENKPGPGGAPIVVADAREKFVTGATRALMMQTTILSGHKDAERNEFTDRSLIELARMSLDLAGVRPQGHGREAVIAAVFSPIMSAGGLHSTSDFLNILANVANKSMLKGYEEVEETFQKWCGKGSLRDFKPTTRVDLGMFGSLAMVGEGAEYTFGTIGDRKETAALATYGKMFKLTRQTVINDDLDAFSTVPFKMGRAAKRTIGDLVYGLLTSNPTMSDGVALFHANHGNLATGGGSALGTDSLDAGRTAMGKQKDPDNKVAALGIRPKSLLVPMALEGKAIQHVNSTTELGQANPAIANRVAKIAEVVSESRLDAASATAWYFAANASQFDVVDVLYLNGVEAPTLEQRNGWSVDAVEMKVRIDAAVKAWDFRGLYKANGA